MFDTIIQIIKGLRIKNCLGQFRIIRKPWCYRDIPCSYLSFIRSLRISGSHEGHTRIHTLGESLSYTVGR